MTPVERTDRVRDAERSRRAILRAAEELFAAEGYEAASLARIGEAAGVSRATPSYFFGAKEDLYVAVLAGMYADRSAALAEAWAAVAAWTPPEPLAPLLREAVGAYARFLVERPTFADVVQREALSRSPRLASLEHGSTNMEQAFAAVCSRAPRTATVADAVLTVVGLVFTPVAQRRTLLPRHGIAFDDPGFAAARTEHAVDALLHLLGVEA